MRSRRTLTVAVALLLATLPWGSSQDAELGLQIVQQGTPGGATACFACHGIDGGGLPGTPFPRLTGLNVDYLIKQIRDFQADLRADPSMTPVAMNLNPDEIAAAAAYYSQQSAPPLPPSEDAAELELGRQIAERGIWSSYVPACASCHGPNGVGVGDTFPALAGQNALYTVQQFNYWQAGTRHNDPLQMMHAVVSRMNDAEIAAVAAYYQSLGSEEPETESP